MPVVCPTQSHKRNIGRNSLLCKPLSSSQVATELISDKSGEPGRVVTSFTHSSPSPQLEINQRDDCKR
eukprot:3343670-Rhodomonas_salina.5